MRVAVRPESLPVELPFQHPPGQIPVATRIRSTLLAASVQGMREMGWESRYYQALPSSRHLEMRMMTAGSWVPIEVGAAHYTACSQMGLSDAEVDAIGENVSKRTQRSFVGTLGRAAAGVGATPWTLVGQVHRIYARMIEGGDHCVYRVGPKEALLVNVGNPLVDIPYFRTATVAYYRAVMGVLATAAYAKEVPRYRLPLTVGVNVAWV
jgi:hypothetical protein